jgi:hypothetical protein
MQAIRALLLCGLLFACACTRAEGPKDAQSVPDERASSPAQAADTTRAADRTARLGEFEPLTQADVDLYLKVMRTAAERLKNLPAADREALKTFRKMTTTPNANALPSAEELAAMQRAGELMALDGVVARELGVARRYESVSSRALAFAAPQIDASGDDERMTAEQKRQLTIRIERFRQRRTQDAATLGPNRDEILALQKQVNLIQHPESLPN